MSPKKTLRNLVDEVAAAENFLVEQLPQGYDKYFEKLNPNNPDRCVDGRLPIDTQIDYLGAQFPGATLGALDALRKVLNYTEEPGCESVLKLYQHSEFGIGAHIDDEHGHIADPEELAKRTEGCGDQKVVAAGKVSIYKSLGITKEMVVERIGWVRANGKVVTLSAEHKEVGAAMNFIDETTLDTIAAARAGDPLFNCDIVEFYKRASLFYMQEKPENMGEEEFQTNITKAMIANYLQTLAALGAQKTIWVRE